MDNCSYDPSRHGGAEACKLSFRDAYNNTHNTGLLDPGGTRLEVNRPAPKLSPKRVAEPLTLPVPGAAPAGVTTSVGAAAVEAG